MAVYYNEFNPDAAAMLRQLIADGVIAPGDVDDRSITEVSPDDIKKYSQCHFFAGIGGWSIALRMAGWPDDRPVWTGSAPCQPFSTAGKQKGKTDERHLFPVWLGLIRELRPATLFGEQVAAAVTHGWLDDVYQGLEEVGYAVGASILPACSVGAPHRRDRLWFVAHRDNAGQPASKGEREARDYVGGCSENVANPEGKRGGQGPTDKGRGHQRAGEGKIPESVRYGHGAVADPHHARLEGWGRAFVDEREDGQTATRNGDFWGGGVWFDCPDGKSRRIEPEIPLLVDGFQHRSPILHALGNAIVPQVAAQFIAACDGF